MAQKPVVAICGIHIESSTFATYRTTASDFTITRGQELLDRYPWLSETWAEPIDWQPVFHARALPGAAVTAQTYAQFKTEILSGLRKLVRQGPLAGLYFDIHGALTVDGLDDAEADLLAAIREITGTQTLVYASMDLHGNVSRQLFSLSDSLSCYRLAPHEDALETRRRVMSNLAGRILSGTGKPAKTLVHIPILLPGEKTSTRLEPAKSLYRQIPFLTARPGVEDASFWIGFAWADQERCQAAVVLTGDDQETLNQLAQQWAKRIWQSRHDFAFVAPTADINTCLQETRNGPYPFFISDSGDNPGAGGAGDVTVALQAALDFSDQTGTGTPNILVASIVDPEAIQVLENHPVGSELELPIGGKLDGRAPGPVKRRWEIVSAGQTRFGGKAFVLKSGPVSVIVTQQRDQYSTLPQFEDLNLDLDSQQVVIVKMGYLEPDLYSAQKNWLMSLTPGAVDQDLLRLDYRNRTRPLYPFEDGFDPNLTVITE